MPSFNTYKKNLSIDGNTQGRTRKNQSDRIMEASWDRDIAAQVAYIYDFYHDSTPLQLKNIDSENDPLKTPIDIKFFQNVTQTYEKDQVAYRIMLKPSQLCNVDYYLTDFKKRYEATFPIGLYVDLMDEKGNRNRWMIVSEANYYNNQFPTFEVLPCEKIIQYIFKNVKYQIAGCLRSQNSYKL